MVRGGHLPPLGLRGTTSASGISGLELLPCGSVLFDRGRPTPTVVTPPPRHLLRTRMRLTSQGRRFLERRFASSRSPVPCHSRHPLGSRKEPGLVASPLKVPSKSQNSHIRPGTQGQERRKEILTHGLLPGICSCSQADNWQTSELRPPPPSSSSSSSPCLPLSPSPPPWT